LRSKAGLQHQSKHLRHGRALRSLRNAFCWRKADRSLARNEAADRDLAYTLALEVPSRIPISDLAYLPLKTTSTQ
jgi:hypothetical protein